MHMKILFNQRNEVPKQVESGNLEIGSKPRFRDTNGLIFHGARPSETITSGGNPKQNFENHCFFVKPKDVPLRHPGKWDTYSCEEFCTNCMKVGKTRKNGDKVYRCL